MELFKTELKVDSDQPKNYFICFNESPLKMVKNAVYFNLKSSFRSLNI